MEKLRIRSKKVRPDNVCKKHPKHEQSPGVCSICLKEKLAKLSNSSGSSRRTSTTMGSGTPSTTSSLSSYYSSTYSSSCSSPPAERQARNYRFADREKEKGSSVANWLLGEGGDQNDYVLKKSRSLATYFPRRQKSIRQNVEEKKGRRFWSRLLRPISKRKEDTPTLVHSRTVREVRVPNSEL
ncbi:uncharacterized protein LOC126793957 [Argentina anserina]|uniref:uncharacterized protein LOC126793957 n=1 Tax=Argentina anserina TaxID=57926 RepID=UPI0021761DCB|nr:uncharacterized protein LOC126793957 [Potentilla anserina]